MSSADQISVRVKKFLSNPVLNRKQFSLEVLHPGRSNVSKAELKEKLAKQFKVKDSKTVVLFGLKTLFGGGRSTGFGLIYDNLASLKRYEHNYRLIRLGLEEAKPKLGRRAKKELKNRRKKVRGKAKAKCTAGKKK
ncbi:40S ribosomal protein S24 [Theileria orientalis]|uniref:40S ribosomal protein S24 n=2 Tax=Theileria orientalis TaxID=68886 RepID=J4DAZ1_THEOR|nr:40S ribosomal protein S24 [Theileria orientalis strain Shintoku]PVC53903.1 40S ribosomal protein S24 [Theileria orientalis]UKK02557.1 40S ribosomal protein S24 [Theileria orientalis]BAM42265.1 40S ribosomal protein S24 [Theileria orientalis strain Shintoku]|eukprot:XP_009692566.1 40S ribosomal protein S24 [Theileria orientalis strain Shintoku]